MSDRDSEQSPIINNPVGISMSSGQTVYAGQGKNTVASSAFVNPVSTDTRTSADSDFSSVYLDKLEDTAAETKAVEAVQKEKMSKKDATVITVLALLNVLVFAFIGVYLMVNDGGDAYQTAKVNASFDPAVDYFNTAGVFSELSAYVKGVDFPAGMREQYQFLYSENTDTVGWLRIGGTSIDGVVVRGQSNTQYERTNFYKQTDNRTRIFFMDFRNTIGMTSDAFSQVTIIYGHHLTEDECIFAEIEDYMDVSYYKEHPILEMNTLYGDYKWKVFACMLTNVDAEDDNGNVFYYWNPYIRQEETVAFAGECLTRSWFINPTVDVIATDKLLLLSTCSYILNKNGFINARCVLCARLVRPGESETVDVSSAYQNENKRMPQVYYSLYGLQNPYANTPIFHSSVQ